MPLIESNYRPKRWLFNGHAETVVPSLFRKVPGVTYQRERIWLRDGDFLDLDWMKRSSTRLAIISHGLEGSSDRHYCKGMAKYFAQHGWDALAWNCRSCSGEMNRLPRLYHHGATEDLDAVIVHSLSQGYAAVALVGFSMGGSLSLKWAGERGNQIPSAIKAVVTFSVPCHLGSSALRLDQPGNSFYRKRFLKKLQKKIELKAQSFPGTISAAGFHEIKTFEAFDNRYTAPLHGFTSARDFYARASCHPFLGAITVPSLIVNAENDPFLPPECYPITLAKNHDFLHLEIPNRGGHVGFSLAGRAENWMEIRAFEFVQQVF